MTEEEQQGVRLPITYVGIEETPILFVNNFVVQHDQNEFVLMAGQVQKPLLLGTPEERREQAERITYIPVNIVARLGFTRERLVSLIEMLQTNLRRHDATFERETPNA